MTSPSLRQLLEAAPAYLPTYLERTGHLSHESKGIRHSEMFFLYAAVAGANPRRILESGRARAQSTLVLSLLFPDARIISIESDAASPDAPFAAERLRHQTNVDCRFGDSRRLLPDLLQPNDVVLLDGPKDFRAVRLALDLLQTGKPTSVFVHDLWLGSPARAFVDRSARGAFLSDAPEWVQRYAGLDSKHRVAADYPTQGRIAYGPTLGCFPATMPHQASLLARCYLAQRGEQLHEQIRKVRRQPARRRPNDFEVFPP